MYWYTVHDTHNVAASSFWVLLSVALELSFSQLFTLTWECYVQLYIHTHTWLYIFYFIYSLWWISYPVFTLATSHWAVSHCCKQSIFVHAWATCVCVPLFCRGLEVNVRGDISAAYFPEVLARPDSIYSWYDRPVYRRGVCMLVWIVLDIMGRRLVWICVFMCLRGRQPLGLMDSMGIKCFFNLVKFCIVCKEVFSQESLGSRGIRFPPQWCFQHCTIKGHCWRYPWPSHDMELCVCVWL